MARKFLAVSLLIFLVSLGYHIYTSYQMRSEQNQPLPAEEEPAVFPQPGIRLGISVKSNDSSDTSSAPIVEEWDSLHSSNASGETREETEVFSDTAGSEAVEEIDETQLPPEVEALFEAFHSLMEEIRPVVEDLETRKMEHKSGALRIIELSSALRGPHDEATRRALYKELEATLASQTKLGRQVLALQDEVEPLDQDLKVLLGEYGLSSRRDFLETYPEYKAWAATH
jgi:hypothetical protein